MVRDQVQFGFEETGAVAQLGEHLVCNQGVRSSNLLSSTRFAANGEQGACSSVG